MHAQETQNSIGLLTHSEIQRIQILSVEASCPFLITKNLENTWNSVKSTTVPCIVQIRAEYIIQWDLDHKYVMGGKKLCYGQKIKFGSSQIPSKQLAGKENNKRTYEFTMENIHSQSEQNQSQELFIHPIRNSFKFVTDDLLAEAFFTILMKKPIVREIQDLRYVFKPGRIIFSSSSSKIYEASEISSKKVVAVKAYPKEIFEDSNCFKMIRQKLLLLRSLNHQNILSVDRIFCTKKSLYIQMETCQANLERMLEHQKLRVGSLKWVQSIMHQLFRGISYLHSSHITHGNITPSNILLKNLNSNQIRVVLTGLSHARCFDLERTLIRNPENQADLELGPQQLNSEERYEQAKDMSQIGLILSNMYTNGQHRLLIAKQNRVEESIKFRYENKQQKMGENCNWIEIANQLLQRIITSNNKYTLTAQQAVNHKLFSLQFNC